MYLTKLPPMQGSDYQVHQKIRELFPGEQRVLFQRSDYKIFVISKTAIKESELYQNTFAVGEQQSFTLRLNPSYRSRENGKCIALLPVSKDWIQKKLKQAGVKGMYNIISEKSRCFMKGSTKITLSSVFITGFLEVFDDRKFAHALRKGIGRGKSFGFGMINIY